MVPIALLDIASAKAGSSPIEMIAKLAAGLGASVNGPGPLGTNAVTRCISSRLSIHFSIKHGMERSVAYRVTLVSSAAAEVASIAPTKRVEMFLKKCILL